MFNKIVNFLYKLFGKGTPVLENWNVFYGDDMYNKILEFKNPQLMDLIGLNPILINGIVRNHPKIEDDSILTVCIPLVQRDGKLISDTYGEFLFGEPAEEYLSTLSAIGVEFDKDEPIFVGVDYVKKKVDELSKQA